MKFPPVAVGINERDRNDRVEILTRAREVISARHQTYVCYAIEDVSRDLQDAERVGLNDMLGGLRLLDAAEGLTKAIGRAISPSSDVAVWAGEGGKSVPNALEYRLAWIDHMIQTENQTLDS